MSIETEIVELLKKRREDARFVCQGSVVRACAWEAFVEADAAYKRVQELIESHAKESNQKEVAMSNAASPNKAPWKLVETLVGSPPDREHRIDGDYWQGSINEELENEFGSWFYLHLSFGFHRKIDFDAAPEEYAAIILPRLREIVAEIEAAVGAGGAT